MYVIKQPDVEVSVKNGAKEVVLEVADYVAFADSTLPFPSARLSPEEAIELGMALILEALNVKNGDKGRFERKVEQLSSFHRARILQRIEVVCFTAREEFVQRESALAEFKAQGLNNREAANAFYGFPRDHNATTPCNCGQCHPSRS
jgi:hypothetical protein